MGVFEEMVLLLGPIWIAFFVGVFIGWLWKPRWAIFNVVVESKLESFESESLPSKKAQPLDVPQEKEFSDSQQCRDSSNIVTDEDLEHLCQLVEAKDCGPTWTHMMDRSTPTMTYKAWQRDQKNGPPQYRSSTIFENAMPEIVRDFFWDDEFRSNWDDMLANSKTIQECPTTGTMVVQWIRKFPFFCKDREYIIGRRIWESGRTYYCVTKGVHCPSIPRKNKPRRVDLYYSSWCVRAVESMTGNGQLSACEVLLFHHEEMGIPWEIAKLGVSKGMWGLVKKIEPGLRAYQRARTCLGAPLSRMASMANINTKIKPDYATSLRDPTEDISPETEVASGSEKPRGIDLPKVVIIGGAILLACSFDQGLLVKTLIFGAARRFGNLAKRL